MPRIKKRKQAVPASSRPEFSPELLEDVSKKIREIWHDSGEKAYFPTDEHIEYLAIEVISMRPIAVDERKNKLDAEARTAMNVLIKWCRSNLETDGLPRENSANKKKIDLEEAINEALPLTEPPLAREWVYHARRLWYLLDCIAKTRNLSAGVAQASHTIKFVSTTLLWLGYNWATVGAVSMEIRGKTKSAM